MKFMPNPGDALTALNSGAMDIIHNPFTNAFVAAGQGAPVRIIAGSGAGGLFLIAQKETGIKSMADLAKAKGKGLKIGTVRFNTFELTLYRALVKAGVGYSDYNIVWFNDTLALAAAFEAKALDLVTHVEPFATRLIDQLGGVPLASSLDAWGPHGPDCVTNTTAKYLESQAGDDQEVPQGDPARRRGDQGRHAEGGRRARRRRSSIASTRKSLTAALPRQMPQVDITKGGDKGMEIAVADMVQLGYLKTRAADHRHHAAEGSAWARAMGYGSGTLERCQRVGRRMRGAPTRRHARHGHGPCSRRSFRGPSSSSIWETRGGQRLERRRAVPAAVRRSCATRSRAISGSASAATPCRFRWPSS